MKELDNVLSIESLLISTMSIKNKIKSLQLEAIKMKQIVEKSNLSEFAMDENEMSKNLYVIDDEEKIKILSSLFSN